MGTQKTSLFGIALCALSLTISGPAFAKKKKSAPPPAPAPEVTPATAAPTSGKDGKVDISDLENKYWAPKDTDFSVVQNRTYTKEHRFFISPEWGRPINDPYSEGNIYGFTANYFLSERWGLQAMYAHANLKNNRPTNDLISYGGSGVQPNHGRLDSFYALGVNVVPFYAKMSFWGTRIIYFDMAFTPFVGMTTYDQLSDAGDRSKSAFTYGIDITQYFFFTNWFAIRADLKNQWHKEDIIKYHGTPAYQNVGSKNVQDTMFLIGPTFYF
jgi:outer membrane beta-barrel protein